MPVDTLKINIMSKVDFLTIVRAWDKLPTHVRGLTINYYFDRINTVLK